VRRRIGTASDLIVVAGRCQSGASSNTLTGRSKADVGRFVFFISDCSKVAS
jgi:hypothetical protein